MIYESSKDYGTGLVVLVYDDDETPTRDDINSYVRKNYGFVPRSISIDPPSPVSSCGYTNPGIIKCHPNPGYLD